LSGPLRAMFLDLNDLSLRGGDRFEQTFALDIAPIVLGGARHDVLLPDGVTVTVCRVAGGCLVGIGADARIYGPCARCLNEVVLPARIEQQEFAPTAKDGWEESDLSPFIVDLVVDLSGLVREAVVLAVPAQLVCSSDCRGLCPHCGHDLNTGPCGCPPEAPDERWGKLQHLKMEMEELP
jgi:uncharacterized protein